jgi:hypothetical protein
MKKAPQNTRGDQPRTEKKHPAQMYIQTMQGAAHHQKLLIPPFLSHTQKNQTHHTLTLTNTFPLLRAMFPFHE